MKVRSLYNPLLLMCLAYAIGTVFFYFKVIFWDGGFVLAGDFITLGDDYVVKALFINTVFYCKLFGWICFGVCNASRTPN